MSDTYQEYSPANILIGEMVLLREWADRDRRDLLLNYRRWIDWRRWDLGVDKVLLARLCDSLLAQNGGAQR